MRIAFIHLGTATPETEVRRVVGALQVQVTRDFAPFWNATASLRFLPAAGLNLLESGEEVFAVCDNSAQAALVVPGMTTAIDSARAPHTVYTLIEGRPNPAWSVEASHALLCLVSSQLRPSVVPPRLSSTPQFGYRIDGVAVSEFAYPEWVDTLRTRTNPYEPQHSPEDAFATLHEIMARRILEQTSPPLVRSQLAAAMPDEKRARIARALLVRSAEYDRAIASALLVTGYSLPTLDTLREARSAEYDRAIARVRAGLGLGTPHPSQEPTPQQGQVDAAAEDVGPEAPRPDVAGPKAPGTGGSGR